MVLKTTVFFIGQATSMTRNTLSWLSWIFVSKDMTLFQKKGTEREDMTH